MAAITEDYVSFETAKHLKKKGFDSEEVGCHGGFYSESCYHSGHGIITDSGQEVGIVYDDLRNADLESDEYLRPTLQMAMKWLREVHYLHITVHPGVSEYGFVWTYAIVFAKEVGKGDTHFYKISQITTPIVKSKSYEQACETAIKYCLENLI